MIKMTPKKKHIKNFQEFWSYYLDEHKNPKTRLLHFVGTSMAFLFIIFFLLTFESLFAGMALISGYGFAWFSHFMIENNKPATFTYPLWSLWADFKMWALILKQRKLDIN